MLLKRLVEILKSLDKDELKKFGKFIRSGYFNTNERVTALYKEIKKFYPLFEDPKLSNEYLFNHIYRNRTFDDSTFRYVLAELTELAEKFIAISLIESDPAKMNKNTIEGLISRMLYHQAARILKTTELKLQKNFIIDSDYLTDRIDYLQLWHQLIFLSNKQDPDIERRIEHGELLTLYNFMELCHINSNLNTFKSNYNLESADNIMNAFLRNLDYKGMLQYLDKIRHTYEKDKSRICFVSTLKIYLCFMITTIHEKDFEYFDKMKGLVYENAEFFERETLQNLYVMLTICCNVKIKAIDYDKYVRVYFDIIKNALSKDLFTAYKGQYMDVFGFHRFFQTAIYLQEYKWAESFTADYTKKLSPEFREDFFNYTRAEILFRKGFYEKSMSALAKVKFNFFRLKLNVRVLMLMIYYELNYIEEAISLTDSFTHFLSSNKKLTFEMKEQNLGFISFIKDMLRYKENGVTKKKISKLRNEAANFKQLINKNWILEKINELENGHAR